ncbi:hypothetical protein L1987_75342 [Smallanthus sonchifolius]|uniref:Uncharacterized protein n=1 Tax=Smallanthus sonchifolius TaxID=185202 RepID=A0ACB9A595_9ASTR|nr:hypothetical protein L1987_75342 [Smallanthus sonchifolius]
MEQKLLLSRSGSPDFLSLHDFLLIGDHIPSHSRGKGVVHPYDADGYNWIEDETWKHMNSVGSGSGTLKSSPQSVMAVGWIGPNADVALPDADLCLLDLTKTSPSTSAVFMDHLFHYP